MEHEEMLKLLSATAQGSQSAFEQLYAASSAQLYAVCLKMLRRKELAEEAVQEAYVRIWHNASEYQRGKGTVLTWMVSIARYRALDLLRYHKVRKEEALPDDDIDNDGPGHVSVVMSSEESKQLKQCMKELENQQKQAIHLAYFNGCSHDEVMNYMKKPLGTVKSWIRRGLSSLQRCLAL